MIDSCQISFDFDGKIWIPTACTNTTSLFALDTSVATIESYAFLGMYDSTIISNGSSTINIDFSGDFAGFNSKIYCNKGDTCNVNCYGSHACYYTLFMCDIDALCTVSNCGYDIGIFCPIGNYTVTDTDFNDTGT